jgi:uncharacterized membrane protein YhaH (DUF805 family)
VDLVFAWLWLPIVFLLPIVAGVRRASPRARKAALLLLSAIANVGVWKFILTMDVASSQTPTDILILRVGGFLAPLGITTLMLATVWKHVR